MDGKISGCEKKFIIPDILQPDALVSERCYKKAFSFEKAMSIIKEDAGSHFDPNVAEAFIQSSDRVREVMDYFNEQNSTSG